MEISEQDILKFIHKLMVFPLSKICRHAVAADLLSMMESKGWNCPNELARAVVSADDEAALKELKVLGVLGEEKQGD